MIICKKCLLRDLGNKDYEENIGKYIAKIKEEDKADKEVYEQRLDICRECDKLTEGTCQKCGCYVEIRAFVKRNKCPANKW